MSEPSFEHLRRSALTMLDDGNAVESVAHVLGVPVDLVAAWRANPVAAPAPAFAETAPSEIEPAPAPDPHARLRFGTELVYAASASFRSVGLVAGIVVTVFGIGAAIAILRNSPLSISNVATCLLILLVVGGAAKLMLGWSRRILVLGTDSVIAPSLFGQFAMAYSDVAGYTLEPHLLRLDKSSMKGRLLSITSRRPGTAPLTVFLFDDYPIDHAMLERLDAVARATRGLPALPALVGSARGGTGTPGGMSFTMMAVIMALGSLQLLPEFSGALRTLRHGTPPLSALRHVEGLVTGVSTCWTPSRRNGGDQAMNLVVADAAGPMQVTVPCILDHEDLLHHGPHRVAVDLDPDGKPPNVVYQLALDGRVALAYDVVQARQHHDQVLPARVILTVLLAAFAFLLGVLYVVWKRTHKDDDI